MAMLLNRRSFLSKTVKAGTALTLGGTLLHLSACSNEDIKRPIFNLVKDPDGICDLPAGFRYTIISRHGEIMSDGHSVPDYHDGMGCFSGPSGEIVLVRNHEIPTYFPSDPPSQEPRFAYDPDASGGTTTIWLNDKMEVLKHHLSLTGTIRNCSGGKTPWNSWISCEEPGTGLGSAWEMGKRHGYNFEVNPFSALEKVRPLKAMGRFNHEGVAIDPATSIAYQTEDRMEGCFYRFLPNVKGRFEEGGVLQGLRFVDRDIIHTSGFPLVAGKPYACEWVTVEEPDPEEDTVADQAQAQGAAVFVRGEGMVYDRGSIYFACTSGGQQGMGQIFKYTPDEAGGHIELVFEAKEQGVLEKPDNITLNQWGDLVICEDNGYDTQCLVGLTPEGKLYYIASNTQSEWSGACFSPDGRTLFANIHKDPGMTLAIQGPWEQLRAAA
ncbi:DUF839 domain-containing protein [Kordiimonas sp. SCSIO 12603]|uniref:alkaline phosphatase PhoX n=1 Tax=Kordiimonas sp. SCSIO 12603 TaxID=2829596 RepID=UPI0021043C2A|nr:alkaline phosphatase PhoX [Kordiimonas sp. SCSIO 12603]UTW60252.1 DUF839 domain-containing protein [Kordiimonas sp. SCSIO 12603]